MLKGMFILMPGIADVVYPSVVRAGIAEFVEIIAPDHTQDSICDNLEQLAEVDVIFSGWGGPQLDAEFLAAAPKLKAVFYGAGSIRGMVTPEFWERDIVITSAASANAVPVSEFTLSQIIFCLKGGWHHVREMRRAQSWYRDQDQYGVKGSTVGLVSLGLIGRRVAELLQVLDVELIAYDPFIDPAVAESLNVRLCGLEEVFETAAVVSLHTPWLTETEGMITGEHFRSMKPNAAFINTARGAVIREAEMIEVLQERSDITAVLDVTYPEPPEPGSPLYTLPNVVLTPHIAGAIDQGDIQRMGETMLDELRRYVNGEPLQWQVTKERFNLTA